MKTQKLITLTLALLSLLSYSYCDQDQAEADALEVMLENIDDISHPDAYLGMSPEEIAEIEHQMTNHDGSFGIEDIESMIAEMKVRLDDENISKADRAKIVKHLQNLEQLSDKHQDIHDEVNSIVNDLNAMGDDLSTEGEL